MSIIRDKENILAKLAALKTLNDGLPSNGTDSMSSVNNSDDTVSFLADVIKTLVGIQGLIKEVNTFLTYDIPLIETELKETLKDILKEYISCKSNPNIPPYLLSGNSGITIPLKKIDFFNVFRTNPKSVIGPLLYNDNDTGLNSSDLNTYLYEVIQLNGTKEEWTGTNDNPMIEFEFNQSGVNSSNELRINASEYYSNPANDKTLVDLNNDFIDSVKIFSPDKIISTITEILYGIISFDTTKTQNQAVSEQQIETVIQNLINEDNDDLDDSFFEFSSSERSTIESLSKDKKNGIRKLVDCGNLESSVELVTLVDNINTLVNATTTSQISEAVTNTLNDIADEAASGAANVDRPNIKLNFIEELINNLAKSIITNIISPKMMVVFMINHKIVYGENEDWVSGVDFILKNKALMKKLTNKARDVITNYLLTLAIRLITNLATQAATSGLKEKADQQKAVILSLFGVSPDVLRLIQGLR